VDKGTGGFECTQCRSDYTKSVQMYGGGGGCVDVRGMVRMRMACGDCRGKGQGCKSVSDGTNIKMRARRKKAGRNEGETLTGDVPR
jgi:hypothetical protein